MRLAVTGAKMQVVFGERAIEVGDAASREKSEAKRESLPPPSPES